MNHERADSKFKNKPKNKQEEASVPHYNERKSRKFVMKN